MALTKQDLLDLRALERTHSDGVLALVKKAGNPSCTVVVNPDGSHTAIMVLGDKFKETGNVTFIDLETPEKPQ